MANFPAKDGAGTSIVLKATGDGSGGDPYIIQNSAPSQGISIKTQLTVTSGAYTIGDVVGGLITLANAVRVTGGKSMVTSVALKSAAALAYGLVFLDQDIATPAVDNATFTLVAADMDNILGQVQFVAANYQKAANTFYIGSAVNCGIICTAPATTLYAYLIANATTTPASTRIDVIVSLEYMD